MKKSKLLMLTSAALLLTTLAGCSSTKDKDDAKDTSASSSVVANTEDSKEETKGDAKGDTFDQTTQMASTSVANIQFKDNFSVPEKDADGHAMGFVLEVTNLTSEPVKAYDLIEQSVTFLQEDGDTHKQLTPAKLTDDSKFNKDVKKDEDMMIDKDNTESIMYIVNVDDSEGSVMISLGENNTTDKPVISFAIPSAE